MGGAFTSSAVSEYVPSIVERVKEYLTKWAENESVLLVKEVSKLVELMPVKL